MYVFYPCYLFRILIFPIINYFTWLKSLFFKIILFSAHFLKDVDFAWLQIAIMCRFWRICETTKLFHRIFCLLEDFFSFSPSTNKMIYDILGRILRIQSQTTFESSIRIMNWTFDFYWMKISNHHSHNSTLFSIPKILYFRKY